MNRPLLTTTVTCPSAQRIVELDGIRGIAVALVVIWHYLPCQLDSGLGLWAAAMRRLLYLTGSGVDLFFVLSGFLIVGILLDQHQAKNCMRVFYLRRACRILPLYFIILGIVASLPVMVKLPKMAEHWLSDPHLPFWAYASFTQNILMGFLGHFGPGSLSVTWSLAVEEQFYVIIPLLVILLGPRNIAWVLPALFLIPPILRFTSPGFHGCVNAPWRADPMLAGGCIAVMTRSNPCVEAIRANARRITVTALILSSAIPAMILWPGCLGALDQTWLSVSFSLLVASAALGIFPRMSMLLRNKTLVWLGTYSYGIYLLHQLISGLLHGAIKNQPPSIANIEDAAITLLALIATLFASWISFRYFESPITRFGHRFKYQKTIQHDL